MPNVNVAPFEIEPTTRYGDVVRADGSPRRFTVPEGRIELLPMFFLVKNGERIRLEISNQESLIANDVLVRSEGRLGHLSPQPPASFQSTAARAAETLNINRKQKRNKFT